MLITPRWNAWWGFTSQAVVSQMVTGQSPLLLRMGCSSCVAELASSESLLFFLIVLCFHKVFFLLNYWAVLCSCIKNWITYVFTCFILHGLTTCTFLHLNNIFPVKESQDCACPLQGGSPWITDPEPLTEAYRGEGTKCIGILLKDSRW